jgi:hypothetical protein
LCLGLDLTKLLPQPLLRLLELLPFALELVPPDDLGEIDFQ